MQSFNAQSFDTQSAIDLSYANILDKTGTLNGNTPEYISMPDEDFIKMREEVISKAKEKKLPFAKKDYDIVLMKSLGQPYTDEKLNLYNDHIDNNNILYKETHPCRSWVRNYYNMIFGFFTWDIVGASYGSGKSYIKDVADTQRSKGFVANVNGTYDGSINSLIGIVVGTGSTSWSFNDTKLNTIINDGTTSGKLSYSAALTRAFTYSLVGGTTETYTESHQRLFDNASGGTISIWEWGLYGYCWGVVPMNAAGYVSTFMVLREVLAGSIDVSDKQILRLTMTTSGGFVP
jgi:hypothetical protein